MFVSLTFRPPLPPGNVPGSHLLDAESTPGPQCGRKDYVTRSGIEPATFWFVVHCLNQQHGRVSRVG